MSTHTGSTPRPPLTSPSSSSTLCFGTATAMVSSGHTIRLSAFVAWCAARHEQCCKRAHTHTVFDARAGLQLAHLPACGALHPRFLLLPVVQLVVARPLFSSLRQKHAHVQGMSALCNTSLVIVVTAPPRSTAQTRSLSTPRGALCLPSLRRYSPSMPRQRPMG